MGKANKVFFFGVFLFTLVFKHSNNDRLMHLQKFIEN